MFTFVRGIVLVVAMLFGCDATIAVDMGSANHIMPGCRSFTQTPAKGLEAAFLSGECMGIIETIVGLGLACAPKGSTHEQGVRVVVKYIDERPARTHENFMLLAQEALRAAWPCRN